MAKGKADAEAADRLERTREVNRRINGMSPNEKFEQARRPTELTSLSAAAEADIAAKADAKRQRDPDAPKE